MCKLALLNKVGPLSKEKGVRYCIQSVSQGGPPTQEEGYEPL